jgi:hypothetical protein
MGSSSQAKFGGGSVREDLSLRTFEMTLSGFAVIPNEREESFLMLPRVPG